METMTAAFPSRPPVRLDNIFVYEGPPALKVRRNSPSRPAPTPRERDDLLPPAAMGTGRAGVENGSGSDTSDDNSCNESTSAIATFGTDELATCSEPLDTSTATGIDDHGSFADTSSCTAVWPNVWGDTTNNLCTRTDTGSAFHEPPHPPSFSTDNVQSVCASATPSAAALAGPQKRAWDNIEMCTPVGSSPSSLSKSPSPAVMRSYAYGTDTTVPADGSTGWDRRGGSALAGHDDAPSAGHQAMLVFPAVMPSVCVALEAQAHQSSTLVRGNLQDDHWVHDQDTVTTGDATLMLAGEHSYPSSGQETSLLYEPIPAGSGTSIVEGPSGACEESGTRDSSDEDIVRWIPKRRRALLAGSGSAGGHAPSQPSMKRKRKQTHIAKPAGRLAQRRTADSQMSSRPTNRHVAAPPSRPRKTITPNSTPIHDESAVPLRALDFESEPTWEVDRIVRSARRHGQLFYKVQWEHTWEPADSLKGSADTAVADFHLGKTRRGSKPGSKGKPGSFFICT